MFPIRKGTPVECYRDGKKLGEKTPKEWAEELGIRPQSVYDSKLKGTSALGKYRFYDIGKGPGGPVDANAGADPEETKPAKPATLADLDAICKAEKKSYGVLQAEIYAGRVITPEEVEAARNPAHKALEGAESDDKEEDIRMCTEENKAPIEAERQPLRLSDFARMADETTIIVYDSEKNWVMTAPNTSPAFGLANWEVTSFRAGLMEGNAILKVVVA